MKKTIYLVRHAKATDRNLFNNKDDSLRPLIPEGIKKFQNTLKRLKNKKVNIQHAYHSPFLRCVQTAELLEKTYKIKSQKLALLAHGIDVSKIVPILFQVPNHSALIGHEPELSEICLHLGLKSKVFKKGELRKITIKVTTTLY